VLAAPLNILYESAMSQSPLPTSNPGPGAVHGPHGHSAGGLDNQAGPVPLPAQQALASLAELAQDLEGQPEALLALLRSLEQLHRSIQDGPFRSSLPADRNALFRLLSEMERSGGWPYIPRLQLRTFLDLLSHGSGDALPLPEAAHGDPQDLGEASRLAA